MNPSRGTGSQWDPTPQRWLEEGEVLRQMQWSKDANEGKGGFVEVSRYVVPKTLRQTRDEKIT